MPSRWNERDPSLRSDLAGGLGSQPGEELSRVIDIPTLEHPAVLEMQMVMPMMEISAPVGGIPINSPVCFPGDGVSSAEPVGVAECLVDRESQVRRRGEEPPVHLGDRMLVGVVVRSEMELEPFVVQIQIRTGCGSRSPLLEPANC
jgi:hypothetical protein